MDAEEGAARKGSHWHWRWLAIVLAAGGVVAAVAAVATVLIDSGSSAGDNAFYEAPGVPPDTRPGTIVRSEALKGPPEGTAASRILYVSRGFDGRRRALSALVIVPLTPAPANGRNIVAYAHGTVGVARGCAVTGRRELIAEIDGLRRFIRAGYAVVVPDYEGLGTAGPHPYLVGPATAHATLDAVRATQRLARTGASERFVVWGVGQGGHAALFTGQEAGAYAPELELAGVAAGAPMANLSRLLDSSSGTPAGDVLAADMLSAWSRLYPRLRLDEVVTPASRTTVERVAQLCVPLDHARIGPALEGRETMLEYRTKRPWRRAPWAGLLAQNTPGAAPIAAPVIITQGGDDGFVRPSATARLVRYLCSQDTTVQYRPSPGVAHGDVGDKTAPYVSRWIAGRFAGEPARSSC